MLYVYAVGSLWFVIVVGTGIVKAVLRHEPTVEELRSFLED